jgi:hypothetical protein
MTVGRSELQALLDPTLFARPHPRDLSAGHWLRPGAPEFPVFRWSEPLRPLALPAEQLGTTLGQFLRTRGFASLPLDARPTPEMLGQRRTPVVEVGPPQSRLMIHGELADRALLNPPTLPTWPAEDLVTNTVVQVQVDANGEVWTAALLGNERGGGSRASAAAETAALAVARGLRFEPRPNADWLASPVTQLTRGRLLFEWRTVRQTNGTAGAVGNP